MHYIIDPMLTHSWWSHICSFENCLVEHRKFSYTHALDARKHNFALALLFLFFLLCYALSSIFLCEPDGISFICTAWCDIRIIIMNSQEVCSHHSWECNKMQYREYLNFMWCILLIWKKNPLVSNVDIFYYFLE